jgi:HD-like signal output (HDOD) protein
MTSSVDSEAERVVARRIERVYELPPMPELGRRILELQSDPGADARRLAAIVQLDPSLAAQVIRYASSSYFGYTGRVANIHDAIARVLGYDTVMHLALGLAAGRSFRIPDNGPLGLSRFWEHAVCSALLAQKLGAIMPEGMRPPPGLCYLSGLLHDFGILLLGHLFPPEFQLLNKLAQAHPGRSVADIEQCLLGMGQAREVLALGHARIGAWLMEAWRMPEAVRITLLEHHNPAYAGDHDLLVHLVQLSDFLLQHTNKPPRVGDFPVTSLRTLQLLPEQVVEVFSGLADMRGDLVALSRQLAAAS